MSSYESQRSSQPPRGGLQHLVSTSELEIRLSISFILSGRSAWVIGTVRGATSAVPINPLRRPDAEIHRTFRVNSVRVTTRVN